MNTQNTLELEADNTFKYNSDDKAIWEVIRVEDEGCVVCRALDSMINPRRSFVAWKDLENAIQVY